MANLSAREGKYYGKYMGVVTDNMDPDGLGRIRAKIRLFLEDKELGWAMPCVPYAGNNVGMYFIPPISSNVWIEFLGGKLTQPIYTGCFWGANEVPDQNRDPNKKIIKTENVTLTINDSPNKNRIEIRTEKDQKIVVKNDSIELLQDGCSVVLKSREVSINGKNFKVKK
jgi:uncharacterized protein involved in type VI secretion and phage assembly